VYGTKLLCFIKLLPINKPYHYHRADVIGFAEGIGVLLVVVDSTAFMLELSSNQGK
jgi:hypothetical protein